MSTIWDTVEKVHISSPTDNAQFHWRAILMYLCGQNSEFGSKMHSSGLCTTALEFIRC